MSDNTNPTRVAGGLKATTNNPRVSEEAKESAQERLTEMQNDLGSNEASRNAPKNTSNRLGGYKATIQNPKTSRTAKQHAQEVLEGYNKEGDLDDPDYVPEQGTIDPADEE